MNTVWILQRDFPSSWSDYCQNGLKMRSCYYDGSFVASLTEVKVED